MAVLTVERNGGNRGERVEILKFDSVREAHIKSVCSLCQNVFLRRFKLYTDLKVKVGGRTEERKKVTVPMEDSRCPECKNGTFFKVSKMPR